MRTRLPAALLVLTLLVWGAWLRLHNLGDRPMHTDEAVQAVKTGDLLERGHYRYDPVEYHGPVIYYLALLPARLAGARSLAEMNETMLRAVSTACLAAALAVTVTIAESFWAVACVAVEISLTPASTAPRISVAPALA